MTTDEVCQTFLKFEAALHRTIFLGLLIIVHSICESGLCVYFIPCVLPELSNRWLYRFEHIYHLFNGIFAPNMTNGAPRERSVIFLSPAGCFDFTPTSRWTVTRSPDCTKPIKAHVFLCSLLLDVSSVSREVINSHRISRKENTSAKLRVAVLNSLVTRGFYS